MSQNNIERVPQLNPSTISELLHTISVIKESSTASGKQISMSNVATQTPLFPLPEVLPERIPQLQCQLGEWVYWHQVLKGDFGLIIGVLHTHEASCFAARRHYLVWLDEKSSSYHITNCDFAFKDDIQPLSQLELEAVRGNYA